MLIINDRKYVDAPFENELELEKVVIANYIYLFGPNSFYLSKKKIKTYDGVGTIPDGFAIDIVNKKWYVVEVELSNHDVWNHISKQISKQILASQQVMSKRNLEDMSVALYRRDEHVREKFNALGIAREDVRKIVRDILETDPIIGLPIDGIPNDLSEWVKMQKYKVKLWIIRKFVDLYEPSDIVYEFPEEFKPVLDTESESDSNTKDLCEGGYGVNLIDLIDNNFIQPNEKIYMVYKPRIGQPQKYEAKIHADGSLELLNQILGNPDFPTEAGV